MSKYSKAAEVRETNLRLNDSLTPTLTQCHSSLAVSVYSPESSAIVRLVSGRECEWPATYIPTRDTVTHAHLLVTEAPCLIRQLWHDREYRSCQMR